MLKVSRQTKETDRALRDSPPKLTPISDDEAIAKMGHPVPWGKTDYRQHRQNAGGSSTSLRFARNDTAVDVSQIRQMQVG
jgi:hypothetical protein